MPCSGLNRHSGPNNTRSVWTSSFVSLHCAGFLLLIIALLTATAPAVHAHDPSPIPVVLDTDMGMDDLRAVMLVLDAPGIKVLGATSVFGSSGPKKAAESTARILGALSHGPILVAVGADKPLEGKFEEPPWRRMCNEMADTLWGSEDHEVRYEPGHQLLARLIARFPGETRLLCLGPLTNLARALEEDPSLAEAIHTLIIACAGPDGSPAFNIAADPVAASRVFNAGIGRVVLVPCVRDESAIDFAEILSGLAHEKIETPVARVLNHVFGREPQRQLLTDGHFLLADDLAALMLLRPALFETEGPFSVTVTVDGDDRGALKRKDSGEQSNHLHQARLTVNSSGLIRAYLDLLAGIEASGETPVSSEFQGALLERFPPESRSAYRSDVAGMAEKIIAAHGAKEWRWGVLAGEIHGHLGIHSIIGVKMGLRAMEVLGASRGGLEVIPHCGSTPPMSCLQDGLMVGTGATPGQGLLLTATGTLMLTPLAIDSSENISGAVPISTAASFISGERMISIRLLPDIQQLISDRLDSLEKQHGGVNKAYFTALRAEALQLWLDLDRNRIFEVLE